MRRLLLLLVAAAVLSPCCVASLYAAPPDVKYFDPPGAQSGKATDVRAAGTFATWPVQTWASDAGIRFEPKKDSGKFTVHVASHVAPGVHWVRFISADGSSLPKAFVVGATAEAGEKEPNETRAKAQKIDAATPIVVNGKLADNGDVDLFAVSLKAGKTLVAAVDAIAAFGSQIDCVLQVTDADGHVLAQNLDDRGFDPRINFAVPRDGDYFVRVFGLAAVPNSSIRFAGGEDALYRLTLTTEAFVDYAWPAVVSADAVEVMLHGVNLPAAGLKTSTALSPSAPPQRQAVPNGHAGRGAVSVVDVPTQIESAGTATGRPVPLAAPIVVNGRFDEPGDRDEYVVSAKKGQAFRLRVMSQALGFPSDPLVRIYKPDGSAPLRIDDISRTDADVDGLLQATLDGDYRIVVEELFGNGGSNFVYVLDLRPTTAEFGLSVAASELNAVLGKPFELAVNVDRPVGNVSDIEIRIEGLPEKFGATPVVSGGDKVAIKTTGKQVKLKFTPTEKFDGPVRIVGVMKSEPEVHRAATALVVAVLGAKITDLWFHAGPEPAPAKPVEAKKK